jgi:hypothetical protein
MTPERLRFEAPVGSYEDFRVAGARKRGRASKNRNVSLGGARFHENVIMKQQFRKILNPIEPLRRCVQFCNTLRKNHWDAVRQAIFQLRFEGREVILDPSREAMQFLVNHKGDT